MSEFDFEAHLARQAVHSQETFGPGLSTAGILDHIRKELVEIEADPTDSEEWIDVVILALDGAWRCGLTPSQVIEKLVAKQTKNEGRNWPDWRTVEPGKAIEHIKSDEEIQMRYLLALEKLAEEIYDTFEYTNTMLPKPAWVKNGNSLKQDEARVLARAELRTQAHEIRTQSHE